MKILVADDNRDAAATLGMILELGNHEVSVAHDGHEALKAARAACPEAVILDIGMPGMCGDEVARQIRSESWGADVLMVAVTGWGQAEDKARAAAAGFDHHLTKPVDIDRLEKLLNDFASAHGAAT
jgi:CheY-like chemotaxis protein